MATPTPTASTTTTTPEATPTTAPSSIDQKKAKALVFAARQAAKDGDDAKATRLAELAVQTDPACSGCWKTVALLRQRAGDTGGADFARKQAAAAEPKAAANRAPKPPD